MKSYDDLIEDWIRYLKDNRIVEPEATKAGQLTYRRTVDTSDVQHFLTDQGIDRNLIRKAIAAAGPPEENTPGAPPEDNPQDAEQTQSPQEPQQQGIEQGKEIEFPRCS